MIVYFRDKHSGEVIAVENVACVVPDKECLGIKGYYVRYTDGRFNLYSYGSWELVEGVAQ